MSKISYENLNRLVCSKGYSVTGLFRQGVISDHQSRKILAGECVNLSAIADICRFFNVPIEDVVEVKLVN